MGLPLLSETIWKIGVDMPNSRQAPIFLPRDVSPHASRTRQRLEDRIMPGKLGGRGFACFRSFTFKLVLPGRALGHAAAALTGATVS